MYSTPKSIAFYNISYPYGGGEVVSFNLSSYFHASGIEVTQYTLQLNRDLLNQKFNFIKFEELPESSRVNTKSNTEFIINSINKRGVEILIVQGVRDFPFKAVRENTNCKILFCIHSKPLWEVDVMKCLRAKELTNPTLLRRIEFLLFRKPKYKYTNYLIKKVVKEYNSKIEYIDRIIFLSEKYADSFQRIINNPRITKSSHLYQDKIRSITNPLIPITSPIESDRQKDNIVLYAGRLIDNPKRVDRLLRIWQIVEKNQPMWRLHILGTGPDEESLKKLANKLGLRNVHFMGHLNSIREELIKARIICLTSSFEGLPMVLIEGKQYGVIPIAYNSFEAISDIIEHGKTGFIIPPFGKQEYASALIKIMNDKLCQEEMQRLCIASSIKNDLSTVGDEWINLFKSLLN